MSPGRLSTACLETNVDREREHLFKGAPTHEQPEGRPVYWRGEPQWRKRFASKPPQCVPKPPLHMSGNTCHPKEPLSEVVSSLNFFFAASPFAFKGAGWLPQRMALPANGQWGEFCCIRPFADSTPPKATTQGQRLSDIEAGDLATRPGLALRAIHVIRCSAKKQRDFSPSPTNHPTAVRIFAKPAPSRIHPQIPPSNAPKGMNTMNQPTRPCLSDRAG